MIAGPSPIGRFIEVRYHLGRGRGMGQRFLPADMTSAAATVIEQHAGRADVYVGAAVRDQRNGGKLAISSVCCLWVDADSREAAQRVVAFEHKPSLVVESGSGGIHAWWSVQPMTVPVAESALRRLASHLGCDMRATDAARILRPAGTLNHKHDPPARVACVELNIGQARSVDELLAGVPDLPPPTPVQHAPRVIGSLYDPDRDALLTIPAIEYVPALTGRGVNARGHVQCPFHGDGQERTPSLYVRCDDPVRWKCFGCDEPRGDIIAFGARLYGIEARGSGYHEIRRRIAADLLRSEAVA